MNTLRGYAIKGNRGVKHWGPLMEEWLLSIERYCRIMNGKDAPYLYNERANISLLAGAAWRSGRIALEEFQHDKGYANKKKTYGRADLWISSDEQDELVEAKCKWISLRSYSVPNTANPVIKKATDDAIRTRANDKGIRAIGIGFFPVYAPSKFIDNIDELIESTIKEFQDIEHHILGWCFPKEMRNYVSDKGNVCPGIIMLANNATFK